ncbi:MAG TPA: alcohol dehydrogenase catalytic domain-containing protein [Anaerovoracaceae bacterium]|nr:alcohol dehydrogenase catalytic domain-containing protein [Anaerovoracaceae bacterium]
MKAAVVREYNRIALEDLPIPELEEEEALIQVTHIGLCGSDVHIYEGKLSANYPAILGHEFSGKLSAIKTKKRTSLKIGDQVVAHPYRSCGICDLCITGRENLCDQIKICGVHTEGCFAEYVKVPASKVYSFPEEIDPKLGAMVEPLAVAVHDVRRSGLKVGQTAYIIGGGPIGILTAIVVKAAGASRVAIGEINDYRIEFIRKMGFEAVDLKKTGLEQAVEELTGGKGFDVVFEDSGAWAGSEDMVKAAKIGGTIMLIGMPGEKHPVDITACARRGLSLVGCRIHPQIDYKAALDIIKSGEYNDQIERLITHTFPFDRISEVMEFAVKDQKHGKIILGMMA